VCRFFAFEDWPFVFVLDPDSGLIADGMTREEACLAIVKQTGQALIDVDIATLCKLHLFFRLYTPEIWEKVKELKAAGKWADKCTITGDPYQQGDLWYVACEVKSSAGQAEVSTPMIKFYEMEGHTYCFIIGSKEKGVVD
jgi:predicted choloylglycine hydrolase